MSGEQHRALLLQNRDTQNWRRQVLRTGTVYQHLTRPWIRPIIPASRTRRQNQCLPNTYPDTMSVQCFRSSTRDNYRLPHRHSLTQLIHRNRRTILRIRNKCHTAHFLRRVLTCLCFHLPTYHHSPRPCRPLCPAWIMRSSKNSTSMERFSRRSTSTTRLETSTSHQRSHTLIRILM